MKRRIYPLLLAAVFLIGCVGHLLLRPKPEETGFYDLSFCSENVNNVLLLSMPTVGDTLAFSGCEGVLLSVAHTPHVLYGRREGEPLSHPSSLASDVTFCLRIPAGEANGRLSVGGKPLFIGDVISLSGANFSIHARFMGFSSSK